MEKDSSERTPDLSVRVKSAVFHAAPSRRFASGIVEEKKKRRTSRRPRSARAHPSSWDVSRPRPEVQLCVEAHPRCDASDAWPRPDVSRSVCVSCFTSGNTPLLCACLPVPAEKASPPPLSSVPTTNSSQWIWSAAVRPRRCAARRHSGGSCHGSDDRSRAGLTVYPQRNRGSTRAEVTSPKSPSLKVRPLRGQPGRAGLLGKRSLPPQAGLSTSGPVSTVTSYPTCPSPPKTPSPTSAPSQATSAPVGAMPTNQSSPWGGGKLRTASKADSPTAATTITTAAKLMTTKVPSCPEEPTRSEDLAKTFSFNATAASRLKQETAEASSVVAAGENGAENGQDTATQNPFIDTPLVSKQERTGAQLQQLGRIQTPYRAPAGHPRPACHGRVQTGMSTTAEMKQEVRKLGGAPPQVDRSPLHTLSSVPVEEHEVRSDIRVTDAAQRQTERSPPLHTLQPKSMTVNGPQGAGDDGASLHSLALEPLVSVCRRDLVAVRHAALQQRNETMESHGVTQTVSAGAADHQLAASLCSSPAAPPLCLRPSDLQEATSGQEACDASSLHTTTAESQSAATGSGQTASGGLSTKTDSGSKPTVCNSQLVSHSQLPPKTRRNSHPAAGVAMPTVPNVPTRASASQDQQLTATHAARDVTSVGSVTNQISAIHLTNRGKPASSSSSSSSSSPSPSKERLLSGQECAAMQVDGDEEEFPDELENACSDDDGSDCSSITGTSSTASITLLPGIEEPMSGVDEDREERPALVPSLFPFFPPTLYFSTANERVELLPPEQRRLLKWKMSSVTPNVVKHTVARSHFKVTKRSHDWMGCWGHHMKSPGFKAIREYQKLNHFPGSFQIGRKDRLWRNLSKMQARFGKREFGFFPRSFILPQDIKLLRKAWEDGGSRQKWIIKPPASARGIGIQVIHKWSQMPRKRPLLVQKYLHKPYLISGNKFDLRIYVYVTSYDPLRVYIFSDGLVRFASCKYSSSMKSLSNKFMHLTNYSVNKKNAEYQSNSDDKACQGHKWALKALWQYLGSKGINTTLIWEKIKDIVIKTIIASDPYVNTLLKMNVRSAYSCHELFGFDIMLDEKLKPWLLEVNISPSLHSNTALDVSIKGQMIRDLLNLAGFLLPHRDEVAASSSSSCSSTSSLCAGSRDRSRADLSTDEKVKRAFYLTQRFVDQDFFSSVLDVLTPDDVRALAESEDEFSRRGEFERVFPSPSSSRYLRFFECPRYLNVLLDQWEQRHWSSRVKGISLLRSLCQQQVHLGTNDPAHMWSKCSYVSRFEALGQDLVSPSRSSVVVSLRRRSLPDDEDDDGSDREIRSVSSVPPASPGPGSSSSSCPSPEPQLTHSLLPGRFAPL